MELNKALSNVFLDGRLMAPLDKKTSLCFRRVEHEHNVFMYVREVAA